MIRPVNDQQPAQPEMLSGEPSPKERPPTPWWHWALVLVLIFPLEVWLRQPHSHSSQNSAEYQQADESPKLTPKVGGLLKQTKEQLDQGKLDKAYSYAQKAVAARRTPQDAYTAYTVLAGIATKQEKFQKAAEALSGAIFSGYRPLSELQRESGIVVKLFYTAKNYPEAIRAGEKYSETFGTDRVVALTVAQSHFLLKNYQDAAAGVRILVKNAEQRKEPIERNDLRLWLAAEYESKNIFGAREALGYLTRLYPGGEYQEWADKLQATPEKLYSRPTN